MESQAHIYNGLKEAVEKVTCRKMRTPRDFNYLAMSIFDVTHVHISPTTLKRFWGYVDRDKNYQPLKHTLDLLAMYVGYKDFDAYCSQSSVNGDVKSDFVKSPSLYATSLSRGNILKLLWKPDRCVRVKYMGEDMFEVVESINSKLQAGDRFCCGCFIEGEPLYLTRLVRDNMVLGGYVCGQHEGIMFRVEIDAISHQRGNNYK